MSLSGFNLVSLKKAHGFSLQIKEFTSKPLNSVSEPKGKWARIPVLEARRASLTVHRTSEECGAPGGFRALTWHSRGDFNLSDLSPRSGKLENFLIP